MAVCPVPPTNIFPSVLRSPPSVRLPSIAVPPTTKSDPVLKEYDGSFFVILVWPDMTLCCKLATYSLPPMFASFPIPTPPSKTKAPVVVSILCVSLSIWVVPWINTFPCVVVVVKTASSGNNVPIGPSCFPTTSTKTDATSTVKEPVLLPVPCVVPIMNFSLYSDHPINTLSPVRPLSITIPESFVDAPFKPEFSSINASLITVLSVFTVVVVPRTSRLPEIMVLPTTFISPPTFKFFVIPAPPATKRAPLSI